MCKIQSRTITNPLTGCFFSLPKDFVFALAHPAVEDGPRDLGQAQNLAGSCDQVRPLDGGRPQMVNFSRAHGGRTPYHYARRGNPQTLPGYPGANTALKGWAGMVLGGL